MTLMKHPVMPMPPEHHAMIAGVLITAYKNLTGKFTEKDIKEAIKWTLLCPEVIVDFMEQMQRR